MLKGVREITAWYPEIKQINAACVSTFEDKISFKWVFRHPQIKPTGSADLSKLYCLQRREGEVEKRWSTTLPWLKLLIETFQLFSGTAELNSTEEK